MVGSDGRGLRRIARAGKTVNAAWADAPPPRTEWPQAARDHGVGLRNLGNSCFLNAVLQALAHCPPLANTVLDAPVAGDDGGPAGEGLSGRTVEGTAPELLAPLAASFSSQAFGGPCGAPACGQLYEDGAGANP
jgi:hypothetical protein